jgi:hypothetical protein
VALTAGPSSDGAARGTKVRMDRFRRAAPEAAYYQRQLDDAVAAQ